MKKFTKKLKAKFTSNNQAVLASGPSSTRPGSPTLGQPLSLPPSESLDRLESATVTPIEDSVASVASNLGALPDPSDIPGQSQGISAIAEMGWNGFKLALGILKESSTFFGPLQSATGGLLKVIEVADQVSENKESFKTMNERIQRLTQIVKAYSTPPVPQHIQDMIDGLSRSIERHKSFIEQRMSRNLVGRILGASDDASKIINSLREITFAVDLFQVDIASKTEAQGRQILQIVRDHYELELLKKLDHVDGARYDEGSRSGCMDGTRVDTLTRLLAWADDPGSPPIFWLNGMAGIGKTAIAYSFCQMIDDGRLGASFFCSRQSENLSKVNHVLPTIAHHLAHRSLAYRRDLIQALERSPRNSYNSAALQDQAAHLFVSIKDSLRELPLVVVIDALDECTGFDDTSDLIRVILRSGLPIKFLITSRPETHIGKGFSSHGGSDLSRKLPLVRGFLLENLDHALLRLHDVERDIVEEDITRYLSSKLSPILEEIDKGDAQKKLSALVEKSGNLFIFAFTAVQYLSPSDNNNLSLEDVDERLSVLLQPSHRHLSTFSTETIDGLYRQIFLSAYRRKEPFEIEKLRTALDALLCLFRPQSISVIASLLYRHPGHIRANLVNFNSVLRIPDIDVDPVLVFHASFPDYVRDHRRSGHYALESGDRHQYLALACLKLMNESLREDPCGIGRRQTQNTDLDKSVVESRILPAVRYACVYWASHLMEGAKAKLADPLVVRELTVFVEVHLLHWLECLSLIQELHAAYDCVQKARLYFVQCPTAGANSDDVQRILLDAEYMIPQVYHFLKLHALEVYVSVLAWLPSESMLGAKYMQNKDPRVVGGLDRHWNACLQVLRTKSNVTCVAFMPSGIYLACCADLCVHIWNLETGELAKELKGHVDMVRCVAFSLDGLKLASGSGDRTVRVWKVQSGELIHQLSGHTGWVLSVAFSLDGSKLASGSDTNVKIWNANTWELIQEFSDNSYIGSRALSSSVPEFAPESDDDETIKIWNADTGEQLSGHTNEISSVAFSLDGSKLASGSYDASVRIWNADTGELIQLLNGHVDSIECVAFSPDGLKLASGSGDKTIRIWVVDNWRLTHELKGHTDVVKCIAFSTDSPKLASGSGDKIVRIWNTDTGELIQQLSGHTDWVLSIAFSPDGSKLASGSIDETIRIWNITGDSMQQLSGYTDWPLSVVFSPDGSKLASGSDDEAVRIWNADTGELIQHLSGHTAWVTSVAFSPDGTKLASGSNDETVRIWNAHTGAAVQQLSDHTDFVRCVVFSPVGSKLASGSNDKTIKIWNADDGMLIQTLTKKVEKFDTLNSSRGSGWVLSVAFSPDGSKLASKSDGATRIWNVDTGEFIQQVDDLILAWNTNTPQTGDWFDEPNPCLISEPASTHRTITLYTAGVRQFQLWIWGPHLQYEVTSSSFTAGKVCFGFENGGSVILNLSVE